MLQNEGTNSHLKEDIGSIYRKKGNLAKKKEKYRKAISFYLKSMKYRHPTPKVYQSLAECHLAIGEEKKADQYFRRV